MMSTSIPKFRTALHHWHLRQGARFADSDGWQVPAMYSTLEKETAAARSNLAIADISSFAKASFTGPGVAAQVAELAGDGAASKPCGVAGLSGPGIVLACRLAVDRLLLLTGTTNVSVIDERLTEAKAMAAVV